MFLVHIFSNYKFDFAKYNLTNYIFDTLILSNITRKFMASSFFSSKGDAARVSPCYTLGRSSVIVNHNNTNTLKPIAGRITVWFK